MEKFYLDISEVTDIKILYHAGWLFSDQRKCEIVLVADKQNPAITNPGILKAQFMILCEGILNSSTNASQERLDLSYKDVTVADIDTLAAELSR